MKIITNDMIVEINNMYNTGKSIKAIANNMSISPYTVKKYIKNLTEEINVEKTTFNKSLPEFDSTVFRDKDWGDLCVLNEEETEEMRKLWEEMEF